MIIPYIYNGEAINLVPESEILKWQDELSKVMPQDFKDWHQNSPSERPLVARLVIENLRSREEMAWQQSEQLKSELNAAKNIIADLLANPYPHDLMAIRLKASKYGSETAAMADMEAYCTEEFMLKARADWNTSQETAKAYLKIPLATSAA